MKNLYAAFLCILGLITALTQSQAKDFSGRPDSAYITADSGDNFLPPPANDNFVNATAVTGLINASCTSGGFYTTLLATPDQSKGTCWSNGPNNNVWFKFTATATGFINVQVKVSGAGETLRNPFVAIYDASLTQVACQNYQGGAVDLSLSTLGLIAGNTYYISVDNYAGYAGSFDLCLTDVPDYDFPVGAKKVNGLINASCTSGGLYTSQFATPDHSAGTCWSNGPNNNRWFKFTATATGFINVQVKVSGAGETLRNPFVAIFDASLTQVACQNYQGGAVDLSLSTLGLIAGNTYYISVDNYAGYAGSFDLCLTDVPDYDFPVGAKDVNALINAACTSGGLYTTQFATPDHSKGTCWSNGPNNNRWFKFTATATGFINVQVKVSGAGETLRNPFVAIYDASLTQVACQNYQGAAIDQCLGTSGLALGNTYYISVDNYAGYAGSFDLCLNDAPPATISYSGSPYCATGTATVTQTGTAGGVYSSTAGLSINAATGTINLAASTAGTYTVSYVVTGGNCINTVTTSVTVKAIPTATISYAGTPFCKTLVGAQVVTQTGTAGGSYSSTAGLTIDAVTGAITPSTSTAGAYTVTYSFSSGGCNNTTTTPVTITALPVATFSYAGSPYCRNAANPSPTFSGGGVAGTFSSTVGLVFVSTATGQINLAASTPGTYTVTNTIAAAAGCAVVTATSSITITALPVATFSYAGSPYCQTAANPSPTFSGGGVAGTFSSTAGLVFVSTATGQINLSASTPGTYTVTNTIAAAGGCAVVTATSSVTITALPAATISYAGTPFCKTLVGAQAVTRTGTAGGTYSSTVGLTINGASGAITPSSSTAGTYTVTYTMAAAGGCAAQTATTSVTITALPVATFSYAGSPYCQNAANPSPTFSGGGVAGTFSSTAGLVFVSTATGQINLSASTPGTYTVTNTIAASGGCAAVTATSSITITALPVATFSYAGSPYCQNAANPSPTFSGGGVAGTFSSTAGLVFVSTATGQINLSASTPGTYTVTNTIAASGGCAAVTATSSITITTLPAATISYAGSPFCKTLVGGQAVTQTGTAG
jgi:hypothetical protein